ncbi:MAG: PKD domain-containing protein, partial [Anaerolineae bacterium]|nr:PKD domain-containing protein [Anaerolineae bacterium]
MRQRPSQRTLLSFAAAFCFLALIAVLALSVQVKLIDAAGDTPTAEATLPGGGDCATAEPDPTQLNIGNGSQPCEEPSATPEAADERSGETGDPPTPTPEPGVILPLAESPTQARAGEATEGATEEATEGAPEEAQMLLMAAPALLQQQATTVSFSASVGANRTVQFTDTTVSDTPITGRLWTFGDGATSTEQNPTHQYASDDVYTVTLQVTLQGGATLSASGTVEIAPTQSEVMRCAFEMDPQGDGVPLTVNFNNTSENADSYAWVFGDGGTSADQHPAHTYTDTGTYNITLTCTGALGTLTAQGSITVEETPGGDVLTAQFIASPTRGPAPLSVTVTDTSLGAVTSWTWDFGDGSAEVTGKGPHTHTYGDVGPYTITLTVRDSQGGVSTAIGSITVLAPGSAPQPGFTVTPQQGPAPLTVTVTDTSQGDISTWTWSFGDGSAAVTGQGPHTHTYASAGTYTIRLDVSGAGGAGTATRQVVALLPGDEVDADFSFQVTGSVPGGIEVCFTDTSLGQVVAWLWNFGDGSTSTDQDPCHTYAVTGNYTVTLRVTGTLGNISTGTRIVPVVTGNVAPVAAFTANRTNVTVGETVTFTNRSTGQITSYAWDFGDGNTSTLENPTHTYAAVGTYIVKLIVSGPGGTSEAAQTTITVSEAVLACDYTGTTSPRLMQSVNYTGRPTGLGTRTIVSQSWTLDGSVVDNDDRFTKLWDTPGSYTLAYTVVLSDGANCTATKTITVSDSVLACSISGAGNANAYQERTYTASLQGGSGAISYVWTVNGQPFGGDQDSISVIAPVGQSQLLLRVVITRGGQQCIAEKTVTINRSGADRLTCDYTGNLNPLLNQTLTYEGTTEHLYTRTATYEWLINGQPAGTGQSFSNTWAGSGSYQLTLRVTPSAGNICEVTKTVTVSQQTLGCEIAGSFPAFVGIPATYQAVLQGLGARTATYQWLIGGVAAGTGATLQQTFAATGAAQILLRVTASDGEICEVTRALAIEVGQQISAIATPNSGVASLPVTFTAQTTNIDRTTLVWHYP